MMVRKYGFADAGVSEAIGFILIFSIVIAGIGLVTLYGYPLLLNQQTNANERIMEKNMIVLQNDVKSLAYKTVPYKETSLKIDGGSLTVYNTTSTPAVSKIDIQECGGGNVYVSAFQSGDLRYSSESAGTDISLQNGAVVMRPHVEPGSVMLAEPRWFYDAQTNTMVINLIGFNSTGIIARSGIGTVQMAMGETGYTRVDIPAGSDLCVVYTPDPTPEGQNYMVAWNNYFINSMKMTPRAIVSEGYQLPTDIAKPSTLIIKKYDVIIKSL
ncbi:MAG: hypothetical protein LUQ71_06095 [Methanoregula sp.]|nr:hypothetical protein [Methanoregula sp.]